MKSKCLFVIAFLFLQLTVVEINAQTKHGTQQAIKTIKLPGVTITEVQDVLSGNFTLPVEKTITNLPAFIRVAFTSRPTIESNIQSEIWLPKENWNGRFLGTGNGGGGGSIGYGSLASGILRGFATANTNMGTSAGVIEAVSHPEIWADFGYRATHEMTVTSKVILQTYYNKSAQFSYFINCSTGGQQALMEAQRYPNDYNGIIAGAPANNRTHLHASFIWNVKANTRITGEKIISQKKWSYFQGW